MSKFLKTILVCLVLAVSFAALPVQASFNVSTEALKSYVIKLRGDNLDKLYVLGINPQKVFAEKQEKDFSKVYSFESNLSLKELQKQLAGDFEFLEIDQKIIATAKKDEFFPNDPGLVKNPDNIDRQWGLLKANFPKAWNQTKGSKDIVVAVIDTGLDATHEDFKKTKLKAGYDVLTDSRISGRRNSDDNGHGTLVTGVIGASTNNDMGIAGAAFNVSIMPIKALDSSGSGTASKISQAIIWAADNDADVINLSLGGMGFGHNKVLANAITYAFNKNVVIVAAAGNDVAITGGNLDKEPVFPICNDNGKNMIIGVTATDVNDLKPGFANYGKACVDVSAPGRRILSTINHDPATGADSPNSYAYASGTSLAAPFVSAQAALLRSLYPDASNGQIRDRILSTAVNIDNLNISQCAGGSCKGLLGTGRIDVAKSLEEQIIKISDGDLVQVTGTNTFYYINGGKKQIVIPFVRSQRFAFTPVKVVTETDLENFSEGSFAEPLDGTLVKSPNEPSVYLIQNGLRSPVTYQVFTMRGFQFKDVVTLTNIEVGSWVVGSFVTPPDDTIVKSKTNPTVYWVVNGTLHPVNYKFYTEKGLQAKPIVNFSENDIANFPKGDAYIL